MKINALSWPHHEIQGSYFQFLFIKWCATSNFEAQSKRNCKEILIRLTRPWSFLRFKTRLRGCDRLAAPRQMGRWEKKKIEERDRLPIFTLCVLLTHFLFWWYFKTEKRWRRGTDQRKKSIFEGGRGEGTVTTWTNQSIKLPSLSLPN